MSKLLKSVGGGIISRKYRKSITNNNFSIICSNCIGGVIYHYLGMEFKSPTVNLYIKQDDFIKMCCDLKYYMGLELDFIETDFSHPVAKLDDITVYFNHDKNAAEAEQKWNRRKARINYDNLYIIMYNGDNITQKDMEKLEMVDCKNKVILSPVKTDFSLPYLKYFKPSKNKKFPAMLRERGMNQDVFGIREILKQYDFIKFLNKN